MQGIDLSHYNTVSNFAQMLSAVQFVIHKATEGTENVDPTWESRYPTLRESGKPLGTFHFLDAGNDAEVQAEHYLANNHWKEGDIQVLDFEGAAAENPDGVSICVQFLEYVKDKTGNMPLIYLNTDLLKNFDWKPVLDLNVGLWVAHYGGAPATGIWPFFAAFQYTCTGRCPGVLDNVDLDTFNGTVAEWKQYGGIEHPVTPPTSAPPTGEIYTVKQGDTLSGIAAEFKEPLAQVESDNPQITNPNRIYPGEKVAIGERYRVRTYVVQSGDNMSKIANQFHVQLADLERANPQIPDPNEIYPGEVLNIP